MWLELQPNETREWKTWKLENIYNEINSNNSSEGFDFSYNKKHKLTSAEKYLAMQASLIKGLPASFRRAAL